MTTELETNRLLLPVQVITVATVARQESVQLWGMTSCAWTLTQPHLPL